MFSWDDVKGMNYKDRELYLGGTQAMGYLDKSGKWKNSDWWKNANSQKADDEL